MPLAREVYQEGLIIPPIKLARRGEIVADVLSLILANVRTPDEREGDLTAQIAANRVADARLRHIVAEYGRQPNRALCVGAAGLHRTGAPRDDGDDSRRRLHVPGSARRRWVQSDAPVTIRVAIRIAGDTAEVDFTGSDPQTTGGVNANFAITLSATSVWVPLPDR